MVDLNSLEKLPPEERLNQLRKLEQERKELLEKQQQELKTIEKLKEKTNNEKIDEAVRKRLEDLEEEAEYLEELLTTPEAEELIAKAPIEHETYISSSDPTEDLYSSIKELYETVSSGVVSPEMAEQAASIQYAITQKDEAIASGIYTADEEIKRQANAALDIADKILSLYTGMTPKAKRTML